MLFTTLLALFYSVIILIVVGTEIYRNTFYCYLCYSWNKRAEKEHALALPCAVDRQT